MIRRKAFTLIEIMIAMFMMAIVILGYYALNQTSSKSSMDAYYEMLCFSLAREPIEIFRGMGFESVEKIAKDPSLCPPPYKIGEEVDLVFNSNPNIPYTPEVENFKRLITLTPIQNKKDSNKIEAFKINVKIIRKGSTKAEVWLSRGTIELESMITYNSKW